MYMSSSTQPLSIIGNLIRSERERRGLTQSDFAKLLKTSQSAIARIESGDQNMTIELLTKINTALGSRIISAQNETQMKTDDFIIRGGKKLSGTIRTNPSKNGALGLICASIMNTGTTTLHNVPRIEEIYRIIEVFQSMHIDIRWIGDHSLSIKVDPKTLSTADLEQGSAAKIRSGLMSIGSMAHHIKKFRLPHSGGCQMGERTISAHKYAIEELGISVKVTDTDYEMSAGKQKSNHITMYEASDTATINALLAASRIESVTELAFAQQNYMVLDVCYFLEKLGIEITGMGTHRLTIKGKKSIHMDIEHYNSEDPIETMLFISAAIVTDSEITITHCPIDFLELELYKLKLMGLDYTQSEFYLSDNSRTRLCDLTLLPSTLHSLPDKLHSLPYPGINTDNLPFFVPICVRASGRSLIHDWMWENRAIYFTELNKLGTQIDLLDPHRIMISGGTKFKAAQVVCPPALRPSAVILVAMLAAPGTSVLRNVYSIKRGYENLVERLAGLGADIEQIHSVTG
jgi:UDP-N-acetylglucosamine 1-carboxyvinyltransferase